MSAASQDIGDSYAPTGGTLAVRLFGWVVVATLFAFFANVYLSYWQGWPGAAAAFGAGSGQAWLQALLYALAVVGSIAFVAASKQRSLRRDSLAMTAISAYVVRAAFWAVFLVGLADAVISFLRVEALLAGLVGAELAQDLGRNQVRGPLVHMPLIVLSLVLAAFTRTLGFTWLALLVVMAELLIVLSRFVFSYEQAFMGDLVRFWYGGLFLFASAHTLVEDGHVRVDVFYAAFPDERKGLVNALGSLLLGIPLCWVVLAIGFGQKSSIIASPLLALEVTQAGFGMYVKYLLAGFLAIFAGTMMVQFASYILEGVADLRGDPGKRTSHAEIVH